MMDSEKAVLLANSKRCLLNIESEVPKVNSENAYPFDTDPNSHPDNFLIVDEVNEDDICEEIELQSSHSAEKSSSTPSDYLTQNKGETGVQELCVIDENEDEFFLEVRNAEDQSVIEPTNKKIAAKNVEVVDMEMEHEEGAEQANKYQIPGLSYIISIGGDSSLESMENCYDCILCSFEKSQPSLLFSGPDMKSHGNSRYHVVNAMRVENYTLYEKYSRNIRDPLEILLEEILDHEALESPQSITVASRETYTQQRKNLISKIKDILSIHEPAKVDVGSEKTEDLKNSNENEVIILEENIKQYTDISKPPLATSRLSIAGQGTHNDQWTKIIDEYNASVNKILDLQKKRLQNNIVIVTDERANFDITLADYDRRISVLKIPGIKFESVFDSVRVHPNFGKGTIFIFSIGIHDLLKSYTLPTCLGFNCQTPQTMLSLLPICNNIHILIMRALQLNMLILQHSRNDIALFTGLVPVDINLYNNYILNYRQCYSVHPGMPIQNVNDFHCRKFEGCILFYNDFIKYHAQTLEFETWDLKDPNFESEKIVLHANGYNISTDEERRRTSQAKLLCGKILTSFVSKATISKGPVKFIEGSKASYQPAAAPMQVIPNYGNNLQQIVGSGHQKNMSDQNSYFPDPDACKIHVKNLTSSTTEASLKTYFQKFGEVVSIHYRHFFAFIEFTYPQSVYDVLRHGITHEIDGHNALVSKFRKKKVMVPCGQHNADGVVDESVPMFNPYASATFNPYTYNVQLPAWTPASFPTRNIPTYAPTKNLNTNTDTLSTHIVYHYQQSMNEILQLQMYRSQSNIVILTDERDNFDITLAGFDPRVHILKIPGMKFETVFDFVKTHPYYGKGTIFIFSCGIHDLLRSFCLQECFNVSCTTPQTLLSILSAASDLHILIRKVLQLNRTLLLSTQNDIALFSGIIPVNVDQYNSLAVKNRPCLLRHQAAPVQLMGSIQLYSAYKETIAWYNSFIKYHAQILGFKPWDLEAPFFIAGKQNSNMLPNGYNIRPDEEAKRAGQAKLLCSQLMQKLLPNVQADVVMQSLPSQPPIETSVHVSNSASKMDIQTTGSSENAKGLAKSSFSKVFFIGRMDLISPLDDCDMYSSLIYHNFNTFTDQDAGQVLKKCDFIPENSVCCLVLDISLISKPLLSPECFKSGCKEPLFLSSLKMKTSKKLMLKEMEYWIFKHLQSIANFIEKLTVRLPVILLPLAPMRIYCQDESEPNHQISHTISVLGCCVASGSCHPWNEAIKILIRLWTNLMEITNMKYDPSNYLSRYKSTSQMIFPFVEAVSDVLPHWSEPDNWKSFINSFISSLSPKATEINGSNSSLKISRTFYDMYDTYKKSRPKARSISPVENLGSQSIKQDSTFGAMSVSSHRSKSKSLDKNKNLSDEFLHCLKQSRSLKVSKQIKRSRSKSYDRYYRSRSRSKGFRRRDLGRRSDGGKRVIEESEFDTGRRSKSKDFEHRSDGDRRANVESEDTRKRLGSSKAKERHSSQKDHSGMNLQRLEMELRDRIGLNLFAEYTSKLDEFRLSFEEEFEVFRTVPELHSDFEKYYETFATRYHTQHGDRDEHHKGMSWKIFWKSNFDAIKTEAWQTKQSTLIKEYEEKSPQKLLSLKSVERDKESQFVFDEALFLVRSLCDSVPFLGPAVASMIDTAKKSGTNTKEAYNIFTESGNVMIINLLLEKFISLSQTTTEDTRYLYEKAIKWIPKLLEEAKNGPKIDSNSYDDKKTAIDLNAVAKLSIGKGSEYTVDIIKMALSYEGITDPPTDLINELFLKVCTIHFNEAMKK